MDNTIEAVQLFGLKTTAPVRKLPLIVYLNWIFSVFLVLQTEDLVLQMQ